MLKIIGLFGLIVVSVVGCGDVTPQTMMQAEFETMSECLVGISRDSGYKLDIITDDPGNVSGFLSNRKGFGCNLRETGSRGAYIEGWYFMDEQAIK